MTDASDTPVKTPETSDNASASTPPALDGSVDALVANLRAAKEQLAQLLAGTAGPCDDGSEKAAEADRSAA